MKRIFLDANVLFTAAHNPRGKASFLTELAQEGHWELFTSAYAIEEARRNIEIKCGERRPGNSLKYANVTIRVAGNPISCVCLLIILHF